jgi:hypothetical protein
MDNASKNAGDMINALQLQYNRGRQASITNELVDIITGASSLFFGWSQLRSDACCGLQVPVRCKREYASTVRSRFTILNIFYKIVPTERGFTNPRSKA